MKDRSVQNNIVFAGNQPGGIKDKATVIYVAGQEAGALLKTMSMTLEHMDSYYSMTDYSGLTGHCPLIMPDYDFEEKLQSCLDLLLAEKDYKLN